ncbi:uncharacterized protein LOC129940730 [Eupeodes corollae]|uniref:uncharacterized protein LOC129940730 n=1 Tax=Eupeodes corollae TaxID=290404 RepID=UPI00248FD6AB|nr:uncharacterized protein LOC129940730 [Eupeodes corollae]
MHFVLCGLIIFQMYTFQCSSEWVKISQTASNENLNKSLTQNEQLQSKVIIDSNEPSPEWIEYQKERFRDSNSSQMLVISGESHLKTSAEIIVPAQTKRNKIVRIKTKISLHDPGADKRISITEPTFEPPRRRRKPKPTKGTSSDEDIKFPSFMGFLNFLTSLQKGLLKKNSFGIMDKIKMLKSMRDQLMMNIENSFGSMFPKSRQKRGLTDESSFQFPPEAALMSISFLTFSVFLIKLVLQVIHIIKSKHYAYNGMTMTNMTAMTKSQLNARKFGESHEDFDILAKVSNAIKTNPFDTN